MQVLWVPEPSSSVCVCAGFPTSTSNSWMPAGYPGIQLSPDTVSLETESDYNLKGSVPQDSPPLQTPVESPGSVLLTDSTSRGLLQSGCQSQVQLSRALLTSWLESEVPTAPSSGCINLLEQLTAPGKTHFLTGLPVCFRRMWHRMEERHRVRHGGGAGGVKSACALQVLI